MLNHTGTKTLETERLILRQFKMEDAGEMFTNWASEDAVTRFLTWPTHQSKEIIIPEDYRPALERLVPQNLRERTFYLTNDTADIWAWSEKVIQFIEKTVRGEK